MMQRATSMLLAGVAVGAVVSVPTAIAATKLTGADIKNSSLTGKDVRDGTITARDFARIYTWRVAVSEQGAVTSASAIPANSVITPIRAELVEQQCGGGPVDNPQAARFQITMVDSVSETILVNHPVDLVPQSTGAYADQLRVTLPSCGGTHTAVLEFRFEVRAGGVKKAKGFR